MPVSAQHLNGIFALIFYRNSVGEYVMVLAGTRIGRLIFRLHAYFDTLCYFRYHRFKNINFLEFDNSLSFLFAKQLKIDLFVA